MEKLIELLNEYEKEAVVHWYERYGQDVLMCRYIKDGFEFYTDEATTIVISKYYGFIKWLVENDKVDLDRIQNVFYRNKRYKEYRNYSDYESLLMLLSISSSPIEDLLLYLK